MVWFELLGLGFRVKNLYEEEGIEILRECGAFLLDLLRPENLAESCSCPCSGPREVC